MPYILCLFVSTEYQQITLLGKWGDATLPSKGIKLLSVSSTSN